MIIGLGGRKRSGKSTVADYIIKTRGAKQYAFADGVRSLALSWYRHIIPDESYLRENKDKPLSDQFNEFPYSQCYLFSSVDWAPMKRQDGGHELVARGYIYNTSAGRDLHTILQSGVPVDVSSRGFGSTQAGTWRGKSAQIVQNFICKAFDAVIGGASPGAGFSRGRLTQSATHDDVVRHIDSARKVQLRVMPTLRRKA